MEEIVAHRSKQIQELEKFIHGKEKRLRCIVEKLGWTEDSLKDEVKIPCPIDSTHWIFESLLEKHVKMCSWVHRGYTKEEYVDKPLCSHFFYTNSTSAVPVLISKEQMDQILLKNTNGNGRSDTRKGMESLPQTMDRYITEFSSSERLAIYDYIVENGKAANKPTVVTIEDLQIDFENKKDEGDRPKTKLELLAEQRDYKRRRQSYRAKNVHVTNKSYTQVMKEIIENQTSFLAEELNENEKLEGTRSKHSDDSEATSSDSNVKDSRKKYRHRSRERRRHRHTSNDRHRHKRKHKRSRTRSRSREHKRSRTRSRSREHKSKKHKKYY